MRRTEHNPLTYIGAPMYPSANRQNWPSMVSQLCFTIFLFRVRSAITIGAGWIGAPIGVAEYKDGACVRCASPIFIPIAYKLSLTNRKRKYIAEKTTGPLKSKQTSITTVRCPILSVARLLIPIIFRYPLPLNACPLNSPVFTRGTRNKDREKSSGQTKIDHRFL